MSLRELEEWIHQKIPVSQSLQFKVIQQSLHKVVLKIPLLPHRNHKGTVFGGSLYNACVLGCYLLAHCDLLTEKISTDEFVISDGNIKYWKPVDQDFEVHVQWNADDLQKVARNYRAKSRARWILKAQVICRGEVCAEFEGRFVL